MRSIVDAIVARDLSPEAQKRAAAGFARERLAEAIRTNRQATGREPEFEQIVDGRTGAPLESVNLPGRIIFRFDGGLARVFEWVGDMLVQHSPVVSGEYSRSHRFLAAGREIDPGGEVPNADEFVFISVTPYARRLEKHYEPAGIYEGVAAMARQRFGDIANIRFTFRSPAEFGLPSSPASRRAARDSRVPAIIITAGGSR